MDEEYIKKKKLDKYGFIWYVDDFIIIVWSEEDIKVIIFIIEKWLLERGLEFNKDKINLVYIE